MNLARNRSVTNLLGIMVFSLYQREQQSFCTFRGTDSCNNDVRLLTIASEYGTRSFESKEDILDRIKTALGQFFAAFSSAIGKKIQINMTERISNEVIKRFSSYPNLVQGRHRTR